MFFGVIGALATTAFVLIVTTAVLLWMLRKSKYENKQRCDKCNRPENGGNDNFLSTSHNQVEFELREKPEPPTSPSFYYNVTYEEDAARQVVEDIYEVLPYEA